MNENLEFLQAFIKNPLKVGAIAPSSPELAQKMLEGIEPTPDSIILELGVGTGALTRFISGIVPSPDCYLGVELDSCLTQRLEAEHPELNFICGDACDAVAIHGRSGLGKVGYVISSLPFVSLPNKVNERIFLEIEKFMELGCMFRTFQYAHGYYLPSALRLREFMRDRYGFSKRSPLIIKNVPPAYTLTWSNG
jgi:phospholipid N-methyltransferase